MPPALLTACSIPSKIDVPPGKSDLTLPSPVQLIVQPPVCLLILSAPSPATKTLLFGLSGNKLLLFFSSTKDSRTACLAIALCSGAPNNCFWLAYLRFDGSPLLNNPERIFTRKIRLTASSIRSMGIMSFSTCSIVLPIKAFQSSTTINISSPAFTACGQLSLVQPGILLCEFQSPTIKPSKPSRVFNTSVSRYLLPCKRSPFHILCEAIILCTPAFIAGK